MRIMNCVICYDNLFFFFQAEDGIRDGHVTGVQTCALPICNRNEVGKLFQPFTNIEDIEQFIQSNQLAFIYVSRENCSVCHGLLPQVKEMFTKYRSEERRVGKECRYRWKQYREKKKKQNRLYR